MDSTQIDNLRKSRRRLFWSWICCVIAGPVVYGFIAAISPVIGSVFGLALPLGVFVLLSFLIHFTVQIAQIEGEMGGD